MILEAAVLLGLMGAYEIPKTSLHPEEVRLDMKCVEGAAIYIQMNYDKDFDLYEDYADYSRVHEIIKEDPNIKTKDDITQQKMEMAIMQAYREDDFFLWDKLKQNPYYRAAQVYEAQFCLRSSAGRIFK
jgi:hypothetical protein